MLLLSSIHIIFLIIPLALAIATIVLLVLFIKYKTKIYHRKLETQEKQLKLFSEENKQYKTQLDGMVNQKTKEFHQQMELNKKLNFERKIALKKAVDANFLKNAFLANMSHEIRTPLSSIIGFSDLLQSEFSLMEENHLFEYAQGISESSERLLTLLDNLIDISRVDANDYQVRPKKNNINQSLEKVYKLYFQKAQAKHLKVNLVPTEIPDTLYDNAILERIVSLITDNAIKYTEFGFINMSSIYKPKDQKFLIRIKDTGIGIDDKFIDEVFSPFRQESLGYSKSYQGAGLGLPLAKKLIQLMDGDIQIKSKKKEGTVVSIYIPYIKPDATTIEKVELNRYSLNKISLNLERKPRILVVEDDKMNRLVFKKMLGNVSHLSICNDGDAALFFIDETFKKNETFDIVLMDINLPAPWDGIELMKNIKQKYSQSLRIPFIAQTAYALSGDRERMLKEGFDDYISKPIDISELYHVIESHIENNT